MSVLDTLITDRTSQQAERAKVLDAKDYSQMTNAERAEWNGTLKGCYDASDMNRVGEAVAYVAYQINNNYAGTWNTCDDYGVAWDEYWTPEHWFPDLVYPISLTTKTDWTDTDRPTAAQLATYLQNVRDLATAVSVQHNLPASMVITTGNANEIERVLSAAYNMFMDWLDGINQEIEKTSRAWFYSGDLYGGEI